MPNMQDVGVRSLHAMKDVWDVRMCGLHAMTNMWDVTVLMAADGVVRKWSMTHRQGCRSALEGVRNTRGVFWRGTGMPAWTSRTLWASECCLWGE